MQHFLNPSLCAWIQKHYTNIWKAKQLSVLCIHVRASERIYCRGPEPSLLNNTRFIQFPAQRLNSSHKKVRIQRDLLANSCSLPWNPTMLLPSMWHLYVTHLATMVPIKTSYFHLVCQVHTSLRRLPLQRGEVKGVCLICSATTRRFPWEDSLFRRWEGPLVTLKPTNASPESAAVQNTLWGPQMPTKTISCLA